MDELSAPHEMEGRIPVSFQTKTGMRIAYLCDENAWVPDQDRDACVRCMSSFNVVRRKHHCRLCGEIICGSCSRLVSLRTHIRIRVCCACVCNSLVEFTPDVSASLSTATSRVPSPRFVVHTTPHPLYKQVSAPPTAWTPFHAMIFVMAALVLVLVVVRETTDHPLDILVVLLQDKSPPRPA
ncbi:Aste57867_20533 [Aphanomyces stellatus]|uniref:Aste57867_20533 protein n=1 Tax=Aphanomyces stellatus TaxID=120398 RepID=A0A485LFB2_9STRA|nr:hypothetical protein As57867_020466 [Aphanomyces stellatus]VFT97218.1 Aste57867_20533 [Aphanomyces stellatus]